jgi:hypothetical protein
MSSDRFDHISNGHFHHVSARLDHAATLSGHVDAAGSHPSGVSDAHDAVTSLVEQANTATNLTESQLQHDASLIERHAAAAKPAK